MPYWLESWWDDWGTPFVAILVVFAIVLPAVVTGINYGIMRPSCLAATRDMRLGHRWSFWGGCQVYSTHEGWIPIEALVVTTKVDR